MVDNDTIIVFVMKKQMNAFCKYAFSQQMQNAQLVIISPADRVNVTTVLNRCYMDSRLSLMNLVQILHVIFIMRIAISTWNNKISPVFDVARNLLLVKIENGKEMNRQEVSLEGTEFLEKTKYITKLGVNILICGAISRPFETILISTDVQVIGQTCGPVEDVLVAFLSGQLTAQAFLMPGCCARRQRFRVQRYRGRF